MLNNSINVEIAYALPEKQYLISMTLKKGSTVEEAIYASGLLFLCKTIDLSKTKIGIRGKLVLLNDEVMIGDRIEIYRTLIANPNELRRQRMQKQLNKLV